MRLADPNRVPSTFLFIRSGITQLRAQAFVVAGARAFTLLANLLIISILNNNDFLHAVVPYRISRFVYAARACERKHMFSCGF